MKTILRFMAMCTLLCAVSCPDGFYYMPFKESDEGMETASFYLDGEPFRSEGRNHFYASTDTLGNTFSLTSRCRSDLHSGTYADLRISIDLDTLQVISPAKDYQITPYTGTEGPQKEYVRVSIGNMYAKSGWIRFRTFKGKQASGNFEFVFEDEDFVGHTVMFGNFDAATNR